MAGRGPQTYKKRQKEQQRKEKQAEKLAKRQMRKQNKEAGINPDAEDEPLTDIDIDTDGNPGSDNEPTESEKLQIA